MDKLQFLVLILLENVGREKQNIAAADSASNSDRDAPITAQKNGPIRRLQQSWLKKRGVVAVGNCTRAMCVRARRCQRSSTESARSPPQRLYIPGQGVR